jgi:hypothetical protein
MTTIEALSGHEALCSLPRIAAGSCPFRQCTTPAWAFLQEVMGDAHDTLRGGDTSPPASCSRVQRGASSSDSERERARLGVCDEDLVAARQGHARQCPRTRREKPQSHRLLLTPVEHPSAGGEDARLALLGVCDEDLVAARLRLPRRAPRNSGKLQSPV